jgi:serine/threonine protein kinase
MSNLPRLGRFELVRKIAAGGMAEIFLARQWGAGGFFRDVVIKRLFRHLAEHPQQLRMFQDEGRLLSELSHPNIPQVYDVGFADGFWYIAMEHVDGPTLADLWHSGARNGQPMPMQVAIAVVLQICEALHHTHERVDHGRRPLRIVHRDVTPQNMMITRDGVAKLMDFGVALTAARKETAGTVRGTFAYMAPEQVRARPLDKRADVFALGVVLYELTTGTRLYRGPDVQIMTQVVEQDVPPPSTRVPDYPEDLEEVVLATLQRDRSRRTPSAAHLAWKLEELAMRYGLLVGPRAVARYVSQSMPAEPVQQEELSMVSSQFSLNESVPPADVVPEYDDPGLLDDLQLLSMPPDSFDVEQPPDLLDLPGDPQEGRHSHPLPLVAPKSLAGWGGEAAASSEEVLLDAGLDDLLRSEPPPAMNDDPTGDHAIEGANDGLVLDGFDDDQQRDPKRPVVLLGAPKRKTNRPPGGQAYMSELERRLAEDDDEP